MNGLVLPCKGKIENRRETGKNNCMNENSGKA